MLRNKHSKISLTLTPQIPQFQQLIHQIMISVTKSRIFTPPKAMNNEKDNSDSRIHSHPCSHSWKRTIPSNLRIHSTVNNPTTSLNPHSTKVHLIIFKIMDMNPPKHLDKIWMWRNLGSKKRGTLSNHKPSMSLDRYLSPNLEVGIVGRGQKLNWIWSWWSLCIRRSRNLGIRSWAGEHQ